MIVYYFVNEFYGLKDIRERRLKISNFLDLNDPFEFVAAEMSDGVNRKVINGVWEELAKSHGILCFSRNWKSPVQWGHYADKHRGLCLGFDIPTNLLVQVSYIESRMKWPSDSWPWPKELKEQFFGRLMSTKFSHWSYEDEYRVFCSRNNPDSDGLCYVGFSQNLKLAKVLVGAKSTLTRAELSDALGDLAGSVETIKVRPAFKSFQIVKQRNARLWP